MKYDFHIHSCLSPCADDDMTPCNIAGMAHVAGLDAIAVTDHNSTRNLLSVVQSADDYGIKVVPGIEVCTSEEIHMLCYFDSLTACLAFGDEIEKNTFKVKNDVSIYGNQYVMDSADSIVSSIEHLLIVGCNFSVYELVDICHNMGGICWYAHIDKPSYSVISVLGTIPPDIPADGVEIFDLSKRDELIRLGHIQENTPYMSNSDAHNLWAIGSKEEQMDAHHPLYKLLLQL